MVCVPFPACPFVCPFCFFFFFSSRRRHTRSKRDWSSDVCSSDLLLLNVDEGLLPASLTQVAHTCESHANSSNLRSEERRVGKECRSRGLPDREKKKKRKRTGYQAETYRYRVLLSVGW